MDTAATKAGQEILDVGSSRVAYAATEHELADIAAAATEVAQLAKARQKLVRKAAA